MLGPIQNLQVLVYLYGNLSAGSAVLDLDEELYENDNKQYHKEFGTETSANWWRQLNDV